MSRQLTAAGVDRTDSGAIRSKDKTVTIPRQKKFHDATEECEM